MTAAKHEKMNVYRMNINSTNGMYKIIWQMRLNWRRQTSLFVMLSNRVMTSLVEDSIQRRIQQQSDKEHEWSWHEKAECQTFGCIKLSFDCAGG